MKAKAGAPPEAKAAEKTALVLESDPIIQLWEELDEASKDLLRRAIGVQGPDHARAASISDFQVGLLLGDGRPYRRKLVVIGDCALVNELLCGAGTDVAILFREASLMPREDVRGIDLCIGLPVGPLTSEQARVLARAIYRRKLLADAALLEGDQDLED